MHFPKLLLAASMFGGAVLCTTTDALCQTPYRVTHGTEVYAPIAGTSLVPVPHFGNDPWDEGAAEVMLPFAFNWFGQDYTSIWAFTNGFVSFQAPPTGLLFPPNTVPSPLNPVHAFVGVIWQDLEGDPATRDIRFRVDGAAGARVVTIELANFRRFSTPNSAVNFQVRLYEGSNQMEVVYGPNFGIIGATAAIENEDGSEGRSLFEPSPTCDANCSCFPTGCGSTNFTEGKVIRIELPPEPEILGSISGPPGAFPGTNFDALVRVRNVGLLPVGAFDSEIYISPSNTTTVGGTLLDTFSTAMIAAQSVVTSTRTLTMPAAQPPGTFYLGLVVDSQFEVMEVIENNNVSFSGPIATAPDLSGTVSIPAETGPGETFDAGLTLTNAGAPVPVPVTVNFYLSPDQTLDMSDTFVHSEMVTLADGFNFTGDITITTPVGVQPSPPNYYVIAAIDEPDVVVEADETNNEAVSGTLISVNGPEVEAVSINSDPFAFRGVPYLVSTEITNNGGATARDFTVCIVISDNLLISLVSDPIIATTTPITLAPGESQTLSVQPVIDTMTSTGTWYIASVADCGTSVVESNENNNIERRVDPITIRDPAADFVPLEVATTATAAAGETIPISVRVGNLGNAMDATHVRLVISPNPGITVDDTTIYETMMPIALTPPEEETISVWAQVPGDLSSGGYYIGAIVDPADDVDEVLEGNNAIGAGPVLVVGADLAIVSPPPPPAVIGVDYIRRFAAVGGSGNYQWSLEWQNGTPAGLSFDAQTAELSGIPDDGSTGSYPFTLTVISGNLSTSVDFNLIVQPPTIALVVVSSRLPPALAQEPYSVQLVAAGGAPPYTWAIRGGGAPAGVQVSQTGELGGEPQVVGAYNFEVDVTDSSGVNTGGIVSLDVVDPEASVTITTAIVPEALVGTEYTTTFTAADGTPPYTWRLDGTPPGLSFEPATAMLTGTPTVAGDYPLVLEVRDSNGLLDRNAYVMVILEEGALQIVTGQDTETTVPEGTVDEPYLDEDGTEVVLRAVKPGQDPTGLRWSILDGSLPPGLLLNPDSGAINGTPQTAGVFPFIVQVLDSSNDVARTSLAIVIKDPDMVTTPSDDGCSCSSERPRSRGLSLLGLVGLLGLLGLRRRRAVRASVLGLGLLMGLGSISAPARAQMPAPYQVLEESAPFVPLGAAATELMPGLGDGNTLPIQLPFSFWLYGQAYQTIYVNANGLVSVTNIGTGHHFPPGGNPLAFEPNGFVAGLWSDWCSSTAGCFGTNPGMGVFYELDATPGQGKLTIEYRRLRHFGDDQMPSDVTFQIVLHEGQSSLVEINYGPITAGTDFGGNPTNFDARIGIENATGTEGMWVGPCAGVTGCTPAQSEALSNTRITIVADAGEDVTAASVSLPEVGYPGLPMTVSARVLSRHQNPLGPFQYAAYLLGATQTSTEGAPLLFESQPLTLMGFESQQVNFNAEVPNNTTPGQYRVALVVDSQGALAETSETNNLAISAQTVRIADRAPDFQVVSVTAAQTQVAPGDTLDVDFVAQNFGNEPGELQLRVVLSTNRAITTSDLPFGQDQSFTTTPREVVQGQVSAEIPQGLSTGTYFVGVIVDHNLNTAELNEANNVGVALQQVVVASANVQILTAALPVATLAQAYSTTLEAAGGTGDFVFSPVDPAQLPRGMVFVEGTAELFGVPLEAGSFPIEFNVQSGASQSQATLDLQVLDPTYPLTLISTALPAAVLGGDYAVQLQAVGGVEPYSWRVQEGSLPEGLLFATDGTIFGSPDAPGFASFTVEVRDNASNTATTTLGLEVRSPGNITIVSSALPNAELDEPYSQTLFAAGGVPPVTWRVVTPAPPGLVVSADGVVGGIPEQVVSGWTFRVEATDARGNADTNELTLTVESTGRFAIGTEALPEGAPNTDYRAVIRATGGRTPLTWELVRGEGILPAGFDVRPSDSIAPDEGPDDLVISGRLEREGVWAFTLRVVDSKGRSDERAFAIVSRTPPPAPPPPDEGGCVCVSGTRASPWWLLLGVFVFFRPRRKTMCSIALIGAVSGGLVGVAQAQTPYLSNQYASPYVPLSGGTPINFVGDFDDGEVQVPIGFSFNYYGISYEHLTIGVNGAIIFGDPCTTSQDCGVTGFCAPTNTCSYEVDFNPQVIPDTQTPNQVIAVFWDDLVGETLPPSSAVSTQLSGTAPNREFVIEWANIGAFQAFLPAISRANFQIRLSETGTIRLHYGPYSSGPDDGNWDGVIGIENETGQAAVNPLACSTPTPACTSAVLTSLNGQVIEFAVPNAPELIANVISDTGGDPGDNFSVVVQAMNIGPVAAGPFSSEVYFSTDTTIDPMTDTLLGTLDFTGVAAAGTMTATLTAAVPMVTPGFYTVGAVIDSANTVTEAVENNNISLAQGSFLVGSDLAVTIAPVDTTGPLEMIDIPVTILNLGAPHPAVGVSVWFSEDQMLSANDRLIGTATVAVPAQPQTPLTVTGTVPSDLVPGPYWLIAQVDSSALIPEADENNNLAVSEMPTLIVGADVISQQVSTPQVFGFRGQPITVNARLRNEGGARARSFYYAFYLSENELISALSDPELGEFGPISLDPGESMDINHTVTVPANVGDGLYYLGVIADVRSEVLEEQETNNINRTQVQIEIREPAADFTVTQLQLQPVAAAGETMVVARTISNLGNAAAGADYALYLSQDDNLDPNADIRLGMGSINLMQQGEDVNVDNVIVPANVPAGEYYVGYVIDPDGAVPELSEANNGVVSEGPLMILGAQLMIRTQGLPIATLNVPYEVVFAAVGGAGAYAWSLASGTLPPGLSLSPAGVLSGLPEEEGSFEITVAVSDGSAERSAPFTLVVSSESVPLEIATVSVLPGFVGRPYEYPMTAFGGVPPFLWSVSGVLPQGLNLSAEGVISGVPAMAAAATLNFRVEDVTGAFAERPIAVRVVESNDTVRLSNDLLADGRIGEEYNQMLRVAPGTGSSPFTYELFGGELPPGLSLEFDQIFGVPAQVGEFNFALRVRDDRGDFDVNRYVLRINERDGVTFVTAGLPQGQVDQPYDNEGVPIQIKAVSSDSMMPLTFRVISGNLPTGLTIEEEGTISGTPSSAGVFTFSLMASDDLGQRSVRAFGIRIVDGPAPVPPVEDDGGCGCSSERRRGGAWWLWGLIIALGLSRLRPGHRWVAGLLFCLSASSAQAQVPYFVETVNEPYVERSGGVPIIFPGTDDEQAVVPLPFAFRFFENTYTQAVVGTNGYVTFDTDGRSRAIQSLPMTTTPNNLIALFWGDQETFSATYHVEGNAPNRIFIIQYEDIQPFFSLGGGSAKLQLFLYEGLAGRFEIRYGGVINMSNPAQWVATTGFENSNGTEGQMFLGCNASCNGSSLSAAAGTLWRAQQDGGTELIAGAVTPPPVVYGGVPFGVDVQIDSLHQNPLGPFVYSLYLLAPGETALGTPIYTSAPVSLMPYEQRIEVAMPALDLATPLGRYRLGLRVDSNDDIAEPNETNNEVISVVDFRLAPQQADFTVQGVSTNASAAMPGGMVDVQLQLRNAGNEAGMVGYRVVLSANEVISVDDRTVLEDTIALDVLETATVAVQLDLPADLQPGAYYVGVVLDPQNDVEEISEVNNTGRLPSSISVGVDTVSITTASLPDAYLGVPYSHFLQAQGGDGSYDFSLASGALPQGLSLLSSGEIRGTPSAEGTQSFEVQVQSGGAQASASLELAVEPLQGGLTIVTRQLLPGVVGDRYPPAPEGTPRDQQQRIVALGGQDAVQFSLRSAPPPGITLDEDGYLHGSPLSRGVFDLEVEATDGLSTVSRVIPLTIGEPGRITLIAEILPEGKVGEPYEIQLRTIGQLATATVTFSTGGPLPDGLTLTPGGRLVGVPQKVGLSSFAVLATEGSGPSAPRDTANFRLEIEQEVGFGVSPSTLPVGIVGEYYEAVVRARQGRAPLVWRVLDAPLPRGLRFEVTEDAGEEVLVFKGVPEIAILSTFTVLVVDADGRRGEQPMSLLVTEPEMPPPPPPAESGCVCVPEVPAKGYGSLGLLLFLGLFRITFTAKRRQ